MLLEKGANVNHQATSLLHETALFFAAAGSPRCVELLLLARADPDAEDDNGQRPIFYAARHGVGDSLRTLLAARSSVNRADKESRQPLLYALQHGHRNAAKILLDSGAWPQHREPKAKAFKAPEPTIPEWARKHSFHDLAIVIEDRERRRDQLLELAQRGSVAALSGGLGEEIFCVDDKGQTALHLASARLDGHALCERLLELRADPSALDCEGRSPLFRAAGEGAIETLQLLLRCRCDVVARDSAGENAVFSAARHGKTEAVDALIAAGARCCRKSGNQTPAFFAAASGSVSLLASLLEAGAQASDLDDRGRTALFEVKDAACAKLLLQRGCEANIHDAMGQTALFSCSGMATTRLLIEARCNVDACDVQAQTALFTATAKGDLPKMRALLEAGINAGHTNKNAQTALFEAGQAPLEAVKVLLTEASLDPLAQDSFGHTAREVARKHRPPAQLGVLKYLTQAEKFAKVAANQISRRSYRLAFLSEDGELLDLSSAEYQAKLEALAATCPYFDMSHWNEGLAKDRERDAAMQAELFDGSSGENAEDFWTGLQKDGEEKAEAEQGAEDMQDGEEDGDGEDGAEEDDEQLGEPASGPDKVEDGMDVG